MSADAGVGADFDEGEVRSPDVARLVRYQGDLRNGQAPHAGCIAVLAAGRRREYQVMGPRADIALGVLSSFVAEEGLDGEEYGIREASANEYVIEIVRRPTGPRNSYNALGEIADKRFFGGPTPDGYLAVL